MMPTKSTTSSTLATSVTTQQQQTEARQRTRCPFASRRMVILNIQVHEGSGCSVLAPAKRQYRGGTRMTRPESGLA